MYVPGAGSRRHEPWEPEDHGMRNEIPEVIELKLILLQLGQQVGQQAQRS